MKYNKVLKIRVTESQLEKAYRDSELVKDVTPGIEKSNVSLLMRYMLDRFNIEDYKRDLEMGLIPEG